jgi:DNA invertase Pin-like site-specific DNA recombinase
LTALFEFLRERGIGIRIVSLRDGMDLTTPSGRLMANVLASVAVFETEVRGERISAGIEFAKQNGAKWGGSKFKGPFAKRVWPKRNTAFVSCTRPDKAFPKSAAPRRSADQRFTRF